MNFKISVLITLFFMSLLGVSCSNKKSDNPPPIQIKSKKSNEQDNSNEDSDENQDSEDDDQGEDENEDFEDEDNSDEENSNEDDDGSEDDDGNDDNSNKDNDDDDDDEEDDNKDQNKDDDDDKEKFIGKITSTGSLIKNSNNTCSRDNRYFLYKKQEYVEACSNVREVPSDWDGQIDKIEVSSNITVQFFSDKDYANKAGECTNAICNINAKVSSFKIITNNIVSSPCINRLNIEAKFNDDSTKTFSSCDDTTKFLETTVVKSIKIPGYVKAMRGKAELACTSSTINSQSMLRRDRTCDITASNTQLKDISFQFCTNVIDNYGDIPNVNDIADLEKKNYVICGDIEDLSENKLKYNGSTKRVNDSINAIFWPTGIEGKVYKKTKHRTEVQFSSSGCKASRDGSIEGKICRYANASISSIVVKRSSLDSSN